MYFDDKISYLASMYLSSVIISWEEMYSDEGNTIRQYNVFEIKNTIDVVNVFLCDNNICRINEFYLPKNIIGNNVL